MKKLLLGFFLIFLMTDFSYGKNYKQYCSTTTNQKNISGIIASSTGINFLSKKIIEHEIAKTLKKELGGKFDVDIKSFYGTNILNGEFNEIKATSKQANISGFYISDINMSTLCDYNHIDYKDNKINFKENFILKYSSQITQDDLDKTVNSNEYKKLIDKMNNNGAISSLFKINTYAIEIKDNKINLKYQLKPLPIINGVINEFIKPIKINIVSDVRAKDGKIELYDMKLNSKKTNINSSIINQLNPLEYAFNISKNKKANIEIEKTYIKDNKINIEGYMIVLKD